MAGDLFNAKPLPEPLLTYCQLDSQEQISVIFFIQENVFENVTCEMLTILFKSLSLQVTAVAYESITESFNVPR